MAIFISGHDRSGTTLLQKLCNQHPQMMVTNEFSVFVPIGSSYPGYSSFMLRYLLHVNFKYPFNQEYKILNRARFANYPLTFRFLYQLLRSHQPQITIGDVEKALKKIDPEVEIVGDKKTIYNVLLPTLLKDSNLKGIIIYRDCRDVVSSFLQKVRTDWKNEDWTQQFKTADAAAARWVRWMNLMEQYIGELYTIRYENLVQDPANQLTALAGWLGISPQGFRGDIVEKSSIGKYNTTLTNEELSQIMTVAGPTMAKFDYI